MSANLKDLAAVAALAAAIVAPIAPAVAQASMPAPTTKQIPVVERSDLLQQAATEAEHLTEMAIARNSKSASAKMELLKKKLWLVRSSETRGRRA